MDIRGYGVVLASVATLGLSECRLPAQTGLTGPSDTPKQTVPGSGPYGVVQTQFIVHRIGTDHTESLNMLDMNGDGRTDLVSGAYWYENPGVLGAEWKRHQFRTVTSQGEVVSDAGEWIVDVNHDGLPDLVTVGWFTDGVWWWENPGKPGVMWTPHFITNSNRAEGGWMADINGDGVPDLAICHYGREGILWIDFSGREPVIHHVMGKDQDGHGIGVADINADGKADLLTEYGWLEQVDANRDQWIWHPEWNLGDAGFPIIGYDVNGDGKLDLIYGQGHSYGLYWMEQKGTPRHRYWVRHVVDDSFSESHALIMADIDGDGQPELITGKRYRGHLGNDPGAYDPNVIYYYKIDQKTARFTRYAIAVNTTASIGTQIIVADFDGDGDLDFATAGRTGVHVFENLRIDRVPTEEREKEILIDTHWPWPDEGPILPLLAHPANHAAAGAQGATVPNRVGAASSSNQDPPEARMKLNAYIFRGSLVSALGGLLFGYDIAGISGTTNQLTLTFGLSKPELGITMASALAGTVLGAMLAGIPAEKVGRRDSLRALAMFYFIAALGAAFCDNWYILIGLRVLGGLSIGGFSVIVPMYIAEIAPATWRGRLVGLFQINIVVGLLIGYLSNFLITRADFGVTEWHWKLGVIAVPAALLFVLLFTIGRSPRWLVSQSQIEEARKELALSGVADPEAEIEDIASSIHLSRQAVSESVLGSKYRKPLLLALGVAIFNQLSGNSAVLFYLNDIFASAGFNRVSSSEQAIYVGVAEVVATLLAMAVIDKLGRIKLLLIGAVGMTFCLLCMATIFHTGRHTNLLLPVLVAFIVSFAISQGSVVWVYLGEIFPNKVRASGQSLASGVNWIANVLITFSFPILAVHYRADCFYFFGAMMALQFVLVLLFFPETKGLTLEELQRKLGIV